MSRTNSTRARAARKPARSSSPHSHDHRNKSEQKSRKKSRPGHNGGGLLIAGAGRGPKPGAPNAGRPPSLLRELAREAFGNRLWVLEQIADGKPMVRVGKKVLPASPSDRIRAVETLGRFGLGAAVDVTSGDKPLETKRKVKVHIFGKEIEL